MEGARELVLALKAWLVFVLVIAFLVNAKQDAGSNEHSRRKLVADKHPGFISIDCGATESYTDYETGIFYESDSRFVDAGTNNQISRDLRDSPFRRQLRTLRSFPQGKKNCYTLKPRQGKNSNYLIRVVCEYGNYDNKNDIPVFDLYIGVNHWTKVNLNSVDGVFTRGIIHAPFSDTIFVCLMTTSGISFISALELRPLDKSIYYPIDFREALDNIYRYDLGNSSDRSTRYSDDVFDRLWHGTLEGFILPSVPISTLSNIDTQGSNDSYKLPAQVLRTAIQPASGYSVLSYEMANRDNGEYFKCYICFHFAEVEEVKEGELREFVIDVNEGDYISEPINLEYLKPKSVCPNRTFQGQFSFTINATAKSTLLPILNAFDIYELLSFPSLPTHPADVTAMMDFKQTSMISIVDWEGDPCVPEQYLWSGLTCRSDDTGTPRIISLDLSNKKLTGPIPDSLAQLSNLENLNNSDKQN